MTRYFGSEAAMEEARAFLLSRKKMNLLITAVNIVVFLIFTIIGNTEDVSFMLEHGACYTPAILQGEYYRLVTGMFLHFGLYHLAYNMVCLIALGDVLETETGSVRYLLIYFLGGIAGNLLSMALELRAAGYGFAELLSDGLPKAEALPAGSTFAVSAGASGAIFAVVGALLYIVIRNKGRLGTITLQRLALMAALSIAQGFTEVGTDNAAHIGGFAAGFLLAVALYHGPRRREEQPSHTALR